MAIYLYVVYTKRQNENSNIFVEEYVRYVYTNVYTDVIHICVFDVYKSFIPFYVLCKTWTTNF